MRRIDFLRGLLIVFIFSVVVQNKTWSQDFTVYNSWDFNEETLGEYTNAEIHEDFNIEYDWAEDMMYLLFNNLAIGAGANIVNDTINGLPSKAMRITNLADELWHGFEMVVDLENDYDELYVSYNWKFSNEFNSTEGGKLPGLGGLPNFGSACPTSGEGFRAHNLFGRAGALYSYHYDRSVDCSPYGGETCPWSSDAYDIDTIPMVNGTWYDITQRLVMNTFTGGVANNDGIKEVWINGHLVIQEICLILMEDESDTLKIDNFRLTHFYGGSGTKYTPLHECYGYIDNIKVYMPLNDSIIGSELHNTTSIYYTPDEITDKDFYYDSLRTTTGTLQNSQYGNAYSACIDETYLIDAGEGNTVSYTLNSYALNAGDYLFFYDGKDSDSDILQMYAYDYGSSEVIKSTGRYMFIRFSVDRETNASGWTGTISFEQNTNITENNPPVIENQEFTINEENFSGNSIGYVIATENDPEQSITYTIVAGNESGLFNLNTFSGELKTTVDTIFEPEPDIYDLTIRVTDDGEGNLSDEAIIAILLEKHRDIVYIDPDNTNDEQEDGSIQHPFDSWQDVEWMSGYHYLQKRGTIATETKISILASDISIGAYGEGDLPVIWSHAEDFALSFFEKTNITIQQLHIVAENAISALYFIGDITDNIIIENSSFEGSVYGIRIIGGYNFTIQYNTFRGNSQAIYSYAENVHIYYNIFQNNQDALHIDGVNSSAEIYNNVFYDNNTAVSTQQSELILYNNIFYLAKDFDKAINFNGTELVSDHNIYYPSQEGFFSYNEYEFHDLSELQQVQGIDFNSFISDPLFVDVFLHNFALESNSPAIEAGIYVGITADLIGEGVPYGNFPDIGVIEATMEINPIPYAPADETNDFVTVYPNPTNGIFNVSLDNTDQQQANIHIQDINGHTILEKQYSGLDSRFDESMDISEFPNGVYILTMENAHFIYTQRIMKIM